MLANPTFARRSQLSRIVPDRRRHKRVAVALIGRFMRANKEDYPCKLIDISSGGAAVTCQVAPSRGERIVAYFDHFGGLEGEVVREFDGGFAFRIDASRHKREKLAAQLTWIVNRAELTAADGRRHERMAPVNRQFTLKLAEGIVIACRVLDVSVSGASLMTPARPEVGSEVVLGTLRARVMRHHRQGFGVQFLEVQDAAQLRAHFG